MKNEVRVMVIRPKGARDKRVSVGMRLFFEDWANGKLVARKRAPKGGGRLVAKAMLPTDSGGKTNILFDVVEVIVKAKRRD